MKQGVVSVLKNDLMTALIQTSVIRWLKTLKAGLTEVDYSFNMERKMRKISLIINFCVHER